MQAGRDRVRDTDCTVIMATHLQNRVAISAEREREREREREVGQAV